jgi:long-chain acyl-CoA synthetase
LQKLTTRYSVEKLVTPEGRTELVYAGRPENLRLLLERSVAEYAENEALIDPDARLTFRETGAAVDAIATSLHGHYGIRKGDRAALMLRNCREFVLSFFALARLGAVTVPLNTALKGEELAFQIKDSGAAIAITEPDFADLMLTACQGSNVKSVFVTGESALPGTKSFSELLQGGSPPDVPVSEEDIAVLMYTSGTTGKPKGALLSHKGIIASAMSAADLCDLRPGRNRMLVVAPLFHITGLAMNLGSAIYSGIPSIFVKRFKAADTMKLMEQEKITAMFAVPTVLWLMFNDPEFPQRDLSSLRLMASGGSASPADLLRLSAEKLPGAQLVPGYGLTEACGMINSTVSLAEALEKPGSSGRSFPIIETKVVGAGGEDLPPGQAGEYLVRGCQVLKEYWNNPEATAEALTDGWLHTGDIAMIEEDGHVHILDRLKDMIIRGGENIYSLEVENVLYRHPKVLEAAAVGVPDEVFGELVKAALVLRPGEHSTPEEIQEFCAQYLARYKVPKFVEFLDSLPRNPAGKIIKGALR